MYQATGLTRDRVEELCVLIHRAGGGGWPPVLGLFRSVVVTLAYLRRNRVQAELAEAYGVSQSTISRAVSAVTPVLAEVLKRGVPTADDLDDRRAYVVDGTLLPCWSWASHPEPFSGKHRTTGLNVHVVCTLDGRLRWVSDPMPGHGTTSPTSGSPRILDGRDPHDWLGDKGHVGSGILTPIRTPRNREYLDWGERLQPPPQQHPRRRRTRHRTPEDLADPAHRLPETHHDLHHHHLGRHRPLLLHR